MRFKFSVFYVLPVVLFAAATASAQVAPAYQSQGIPLTVGLGPSSYDVDWGHGRMYGGTVWVDWYPIQLPKALAGLGVEFEARDISLHNVGFGQKNVRQDTAGGGGIYTWRRFENFRPDFKFLVEDGSVDFTSPSPTYSHDTRFLLAPGGGFQYRIYHQLWARADYEYQIWEGALLGNKLNPQGFTVGVQYDFAHPYQK